MLDILEKICSGRGKDGDIELLTELAESIKMGSLCGLGQTAPNPVLTTIQYFKEEYEEHIHDMKCRAGACKNLVSFEVNPETCKGCGACLRACPVEAIAGEKKQPHAIDQELCIRCGSCVDTCKFDSILIV